MPPKRLKGKKTKNDLITEEINQNDPILENCFGIITNFMDR